jgi:hypothetical protein
MRELSEIRETFVQMLQGAFHPRIKYPEIGPYVAEGSSRPAEMSSLSDFEVTSESVLAADKSQEDVAC